MSKYKAQLITTLNAALQKDCADVIAELYAIGILDDTLARRGCVVHEYMSAAIDTSRSETVVLSEIAERHGVHERTAWKYVQFSRLP
jgi:hypothetical protein